jgi:hypothetical protein
MKPPDRAAEAVAAWLARTDEQAGGRPGAVAAVENAAADLARAEAVFLDLRGRARTNAEDLDYWLEGVRHTAFCAAFSLALLRGRLANDARALRERLDGLREQTRRRFAATFPPASVAEELAIRYAFHEAVLAAGR